MNKRGFTLVELLIVVVILGIISVMSFPLIRGLITKNEDKKYEIYAKSMVDSSKLYVDSYWKDLFGNHESGCAFITWKDLKEKSLIKDIDISNISCNSDSSFVKVVKLRDKYSYTPFLGCGVDYNGTTKEVIIGYPEKEKVYSMDSFVCNGVDEASISIKAVPEKEGEKYDKKIRSTKLVIESPTGINVYNDIFYAFVPSKDFNSIDSWTKAKFKIPTNQDKKIEKGEVIKASTETIQTPFGNGDYYLLVRVENLKDFVGRDYNNPLNPKSNELVYGPFKIDNEKPVINSKNVTSTTAGYNNLNVNVDLGVADNLTSKSDLLLCVSNSKCKDNDYKKYNDRTALKLTGDYDGGTRTVYIGVKDLAGNKEETTATYTVYKNCSKLKDIGNSGWVNASNCSKPCGDGTIKQQRDRHDRYTGIYCQKETRNATCNLGTCCSYLNYSGCEKMYLCRSAETNRFVPGTNNMWDKVCGTRKCSDSQQLSLVTGGAVYILNKSGSYYYVRVSSSGQIKSNNPHYVGNHNYGYIYKGCLKSVSPYSGSWCTGQTCKN